MGTYFKYKSNRPINLEAVEYFELVLTNTSNEIVFYFKNKQQITWSLSSIEECRVVYNEAFKNLKIIKANNKKTKALNSALAKLQNG